MSIFNERTRTILKEELKWENTKTRKVGGSEVSYIEAQYAIREANRAFDFEWSNKTVDLKFLCAYEKPASSGKGTNHYVCYSATVSVEHNGIVHEGSGFGSGINSDLGAAYEGAIKEAESDAKKRALINFGDIFGLALYDKAKAHVTDQAVVTYDQEQEILIAMNEGKRDRVKELITIFSIPLTHSIVQKCREFFLAQDASKKLPDNTMILEA